MREADLRQIMRDDRHWNLRHPDHAALRRRVEEGYKALYPGPAKYDATGKLINDREDGPPLGRVPVRAFPAAWATRSSRSLPMNAARRRARAARTGANGSTIPSRRFARRSPAPSRATTSPAMAIANKAR